MREFESKPNMDELEARHYLLSYNLKHKPRADGLDEGVDHHLPHAKEALLDAFRQASERGQRPGIIALQECKWVTYNIVEPVKNQLNVICEYDGNQRGWQHVRQWGDGGFNNGQDTVLLYDGCKYTGKALPIKDEYEEGENVGAGMDLGQFQRRWAAAQLMVKSRPNEELLVVSYRASNGATEEWSQGFVDGIGKVSQGLQRRSPNSHAWGMDALIVGSWGWNVATTFPEYRKQSETVLLMDYPVVVNNVNGDRAPQVRILQSQVLEGSLIRLGLERGQGYRNGDRMAHDAVLVTFEMQSAASDAVKEGNEVPGTPFNEDKAIRTKCESASSASSSGKSEKADWVSHHSTRRDLNPALDEAKNESHPAATPNHYLLSYNVASKYQEFPGWKTIPDNERIDPLPHAKEALLDAFRKASERGQRPGIIALQECKWVTYNIVEPVKNQLNVICEYDGNQRGWQHVRQWGDGGFNNGQDTVLLYDGCKYTGKALPIKDEYEEGENVGAGMDLGQFQRRWAAAQLMVKSRPNEELLVVSYRASNGATEEWSQAFARGVGKVSQRLPRSTNRDDRGMDALIVGSWNCDVVTAFPESAIGGASVLVTADGIMQAVATRSLQNTPMGRRGSGMDYPVAVSHVNNDHAPQVQILQSQVLESSLIRTRFLTMTGGKPKTMTHDAILVEFAMQSEASSFARNEPPMHRTPIFQDTLPVGEGFGYRMMPPGVPHPEELDESRRAGETDQSRSTARNQREDDHPMHRSSEPTNGLRIPADNQPVFHSQDVYDTALFRSMILIGIMTWDVVKFFMRRRPDTK